jgi:hypothetical protein
MRKTLGTAVFSGMLGVTLFGIFLTPVFFYVIEGAIESGPFAWASTRLFGRILSSVLTILTLGIFWWPTIFQHASRRLRRAAGRPERPPLSPSQHAARSGNGVSEIQQGEPEFGPRPSPSVDSNGTDSGDSSAFAGGSHHLRNE